MATYTPTSKVIGTTGVTGNAGFIALLTAQNTAVGTAVTTALALTGYQPQTLQISPATYSDGTSGLLYMTQTLTYILLV